MQAQARQTCTWWVQGANTGAHLAPLVCYGGLSASGATMGSVGSAMGRGGLGGRRRETSQDA